MLIALLLSSSMAWANTKPARIWATATFNKEKVLVGEPLVVTVTVYTSTWFTQPPVFSEIQVQGALMVRLEQRSGARSVTIGRQQYPAIQQQFVVYPSVIGTNRLPAFEVITTSPPEGGYKGIERVIKTKERTFEVLGPPEGTDTSNWMTAFDLQLTESWDRPLEDLKAGDILERRIRIEASGTLSAAIAPPVIEDIDFGSIYPQTPQLSNRQMRGSFNGTRTEILRYLLEKDGQFEIPALEMNYFSLKDKELRSKSLPATALDIAPNPDLAFILSQQELLQAELAKEQPQENVVEPSWSYLGLNAWQWSLLLLAGIGLLVILGRWFKRFQIRRARKQVEHLDSEAYHFQQLEHISKTGTNRELIRQLGFWFDRYRLSGGSRHLRTLAKSDPQDELNPELDKLSDLAYRQDQLDQSQEQGPSLVEGIKRARKQQNKKRDRAQQRYWDQLNPS